MSNPLLNEKSLERVAARSEGVAGWAAPTAGSAGTSPDTASGTTWNPPVTDGPVTTWDKGVMTASGAASATLVLLLILLVSAGITWMSMGTPVAGELKFPTAAVLIGVFGALACVMVSTFKPRLSRILAPLYAVGEGIVVGAISRAYDAQYNGIVLQAVGATAAVFVTMLFLYRTRVIKVTDRSRRIAMSMMMGLLGFYLVAMVFSLFGANVSFLHDSSLLGIGLSVFVSGLAAYNLALDFDMIERAERNKMPSYMEWYCALGVTVTLVWLYLELLRLLARLQDR